MLIDFHTHAFPDFLAEKAIGKLAQIGKLTPLSNGTADGLRTKMKLWGVDLSVVQNIATNPKQQQNVNAFAEQLNRENNALLAFASIHPESENPRRAVLELAEREFKGIKLHPDYMGIPIDDERYAPILSAAADTGLIVTIHAGYDFISPDFIHATPDRIQKVLARYPTLKLVCAHMGSNRMWKEVLEKLCGKNVYFDTSLASGALDPVLAEKIICSHDENKILFGSDMPWGSPEAEQKYIENLSVPETVKQKIFYQNAQKLLRL